MGEIDPNGSIARGKSFNDEDDGFEVLDVNDVMDKNMVFEEKKKAKD